MAGNKRAVRWKQVEASRAIRATEAAGLRVDSVECRTDGTIIVHTTKDMPAVPVDEIVLKS
jgi:hypothetical protein